MDGGDDERACLSLECNLTGTSRRTAVYAKASKLFRVFRADVRKLGSLTRVPRAPRVAMSMDTISEGYNLRRPYHRTPLPLL